ncbi:penicillin-binding transpeptidase domain-containing protein [Marinactinospora thermotolerans]|uniref:Beta-lactamase class D n=1 Tax=Marinactinospora thermotolerans DSM 45154 TaxID=1122192 RepID=A0A1T4R199_9ACTN|nr:penicillin-binding transpeptidase domain-containing protein [Marinactinospora thermotolerans]SKA09760.1 beta-lactamase class D [Marinactinospora thermotolerans DSM 45154]
MSRTSSTVVGVRVVALLAGATLTVTGGCAPPGEAGGDSAARVWPGMMPETAPSPRTVVRDDLEKVFEEADTDGAFVLYDVERNLTTVVGRERAAHRHPPAETFEIAATLIALETDTVPSVDETVRHDGNADWERDASLREAVVSSDAGVHREVARRVGPDRMRTWVDRLGYGNRETGESGRPFWLDGTLEISPREQADFLADLARGRLPTSEAHQRDVRELLFLEHGPGYVLYGKSGLAGRFNPGAGWWVGWVRREDGVFSFALAMDVVTDKHVEQRVPLGREFLERLNVVPVP